MAQPYYINPALANPFIRQYREWDWWDARGKQECESEYLPQVAVQDRVKGQIVCFLSGFFVVVEL